MDVLRTHQLPILLRNIADPPRVLYKRGADLRGDSAYVAIVGTRAPSVYGKRMAYKVAAAVAEAGGVVVSGLAFGVDGLAHRAAVDARRPTVAFLASGVERVTPSSHIRLAHDIVAHGGTMLSEYEAFDSAHKYRFLERNRLISGLCKATIVIEAKERSGALITARHAFDQNRDVYALMGDIDRPQAQGCLNLVRTDIAQPVVSIDHLLEEIGLDIHKERRGVLTAMEQKVLEAIEKGRPVESAGGGVAERVAALSSLELLGFVERGPRGVFRLKVR